MPSCAAPRFCPRCRNKFTQTVSRAAHPAWARACRLESLGAPLEPAWLPTPSKFRREAASPGGYAAEVIAARQPSADSGVRLAELMAALSLATDLGMGQPVETALASCVVVMRLGEALGLDATTLRTAYYYALL